MSAGWRLAFLVSHIVQWVFIICLVKQYPFVDPDLYEKIGVKPDAFQVAVQLGRFDFATMLLTVLGITLTIAGVFGFIEVRSRSEAKAIEVAGPAAQTAAKEQAKVTAASVAREVAEQEIRPEATRIIQEFFDFKGIDLDSLPKKTNAMDVDENQALADSFDKDGNHG